MQAWRSYKQGNIVQMIDPEIIERCDEEQALRCIHVGLLCTQADSSLRPQMSTVTLMLSSHSVTLLNPTKPAFCEFSNWAFHHCFGTKYDTYFRFYKIKLCMIKQRVEYL
jgi:hypothetical protein